MRVAGEGTPNVRATWPLDILALPWNPPWPIDVCYAANVLHMLDEHGADCVLRGAADILRPGGRLILYGPFAIDGGHTSPGNRAFDAALRADGAGGGGGGGGGGVRDLTRLDEIAHACGFEPSRRTVMCRATTVSSSGSAVTKGRNQRCRRHASARTEPALASRSWRDQ